jgi:hypothetical protein
VVYQHSRGAYPDRWKATCLVHRPEDGLRGAEVCSEHYSILSGTQLRRPCRMPHDVLFRTTARCSVGWPGRKMGDQAASTAASTQPSPRPRSEKQSASTTARTTAVPTRNGNQCFTSGNTGHYAKDCPQNQPRPVPAADLGKGKKQKVQVEQGRLNFTTLEELPEGAPVMADIFSVFNQPALILFDSSATHSFISPKSNVKCHYPSIILKGLL